MDEDLQKILDDMTHAEKDEIIASRVRDMCYKEGEYDPVADIRRLSDTERPAEPIDRIIDRLGAIKRRKSPEIPTCTCRCHQEPIRIGHVAPSCCEIPNEIYIESDGSINQARLTKCRNERDAHTTISEENSSE